MRAVFLGFETSILDALGTCCEIVGVYVPAPRSPLRAVRYWPLKSYGVRARVKGLLAKYPSRFRSWHRRLLRYHTADLAHERGLPQLIAPSVNHEKFLKQLSALKPDLGVVANFGEILKEPALRIPTYGFINFHPSLLPQYRGPSPLPHMVLRGERRAGVTWHQVSPTIDAGDILSQQTFDIADADTVATLTNRSVQTAVAMLPALIRSIESGTCRRTPQDESRASYFPKLSPAQKQVVKALDDEKRQRCQMETA